MKKPLNPEDRLAILQEVDCDRKWFSLDDYRLCSLCDKVITGRQIEIRLESEGRYELRCPTNGCAATVKDWSYPGDSLLSRRERDSQPREREIDLGALFADTSET